MIYDRILSIRNKYSTKEIIQILDRKFGFAWLECLLSRKWYNIPLTIWLNFRSLPLKQAIKLPISVYGCPRFYSLSGDMYIEGKVKHGMIKFNHCQIGAPNNLSLNTEIVNQGMIIFHGPGLIGTGNKIVVEGTLSIGKHFKITDMVNISCYNSIEIGDQTWIVHRSQVMDTNYHYLVDLQNQTIKNHTESISLGSGCWVGNSCSIMGGAKLPNHTIVCSHSLVNREFIEPCSVIAGIPAKTIKKGIVRLDNTKINKSVYEYYRNNSNKIFEYSDIDIPEFTKIEI